MDLRLIFCLLFSLSHSLEARELYWVSTFGDWFDGQKWSLSSGGSPCGCTPTTGDTTYLNNVGSIVTIHDGETAKAHQVQIGFNATLKIGKTLGSNATLAISDSDVGLIVQGTLLTYGVVKVSRTPKRGVYILNGGTCKIMPGATIEIRPEVGIIDTLVHNEGLIQILADVNNGKGQLLLEDAGSLGILSSGSSAQIENHGFIRIDSTLNQQGFGILNTSSSTLNNYATISLIRCDGIGIQIEENASLTNQSSGEIKLENMYETSIFFLDGNFDNFGLINLSNSSANYAIQTIQPFTNNGTIDGHHQAGVAISANTNLTNQGLIYIENSVLGIQILQDSLINIGEIHITEGSTGIYMATNSTLLQNEGKIHLEGLLTGINLVGFFDNFAECHITGIGNIGIYLLETTMRNYGKLEIGQSPLDEIGIFFRHAATLRNECSATMILAPGLFASSPNANIINHGYMQLDLNLLLLEGTFENYGIISDLKNILENLNSRYEGNGLLLRPLAGQHVISIPSSGIIAGDLSTFSFDPILYYDAEFTAPAGVFDSNENTWTPGMPSGLATIYHNISNACTSFVARQELNDDVFSSCPSYPNINTKSTTGSWNDHEHWSMDQIPTRCHDVVIPGDMTDISGAQMGQARTIEIQPNAFFEVQGELDVSGN